MANLSIAIVGLPNVGKSTLFNALTAAHALAANYPFATIEPNVGMVPVPDERLAVLAKIVGTEKIVPATVRFVDVAGLVAGASQGEGLGNQFLSHIRSCQAIVEVVRAFNDPDVTTPDSHGAAKDIEVINTELVLADLATLNSRLDKVAKEAKANPKLAPLVEAYRAAQKLLDSGQPLWQDQNLDLELLADLQLLTAKPMIYLFNLSEADLSDQAKKAELAKLVAPVSALFVSAKLESEIAELDETDRREMLLSYAQSESGLNQLVKTGFKVLGLQSFLTAGPKEVRAWTIKQGALAPQAAGAIHSDIERGFIAAEVVSYDDLVAAGSLPQARSAGKLRTEGKQYEMRPGDVVNFKFNV